MARFPNLPLAFAFTFAFAMVKVGMAKGEGEVNKKNFVNRGGKLECYRLIV